MRHNVGNIDRVVRGAVGIALAVGAFSAGAPLIRAILGVVALIMVGTALVGVCPLYQVFGFNTCQRKPR
jgi:uncharacterized membrane protein YuzA (DUF378 family)